MFTGASTIKLPAGVPKSYDGCANIKDYPSTPFAVPPFQAPYSFSPIKQSAGATCNDESCMDVFDVDEVYVPDFPLIPKDICPGGTKMLLYDGLFPGPTFTQPFGRQVRMPVHLRAMRVQLRAPGFGSFRFGSAVCTLCEKLVVCDAP